jgi:hypothetical protein
MSHIPVFAACASCRRHVRGEGPCPFCARRGVLSLAGAAVLVTVAACGPSQTTQDTVVVTPSTATAPPPQDNAPVPSASGATTSRPSPSTKDAPPPQRPETRVHPLYGGPPPDFETAFV